MLEAIRPFRLRLQGRVQSIVQGQILKLDSKDAERLLQKAPDRVRPIVSSEDAPALSHPVTSLRPVYWESMDGTILGPAQVLYVTQDGTEFWLCVAYDRFLYWIRDGLLRSRQEFETQKRWTCSCCHGIDYWSSAYRARICRICHPPASPELEKEPRNDH